MLIITTLSAAEEEEPNFWSPKSRFIYNRLSSPLVAAAARRVQPPSFDWDKANDRANWLTEWLRKEAAKR